MQSKRSTSCSSLTALLAVLLLEVDEEVGVDLAPDLVARLGVRHALDHAALKVGDGRVLDNVTNKLQGDPSGWLKPPVDLDLGCSTILPGQ